MTLYGEGAKGMADKQKMTVEEAQATIDKVMGAMPQMKQYIEYIHSYAKQYGHVETLQGNWRRLPNINSKNFSLQSADLRKSVNSVVQGTGAYCTNTSLIILRELFRKRKLKSRLVVTVHDSIVIDVHPDEVSMVIKLVNYVMSHLPIKQFKCKMSDYHVTPQDVAKEYYIDDTYFNFPFPAESAVGLTYAQDVDYDQADLDYFNGSLKQWLEFSDNYERVDDIFNALLTYAKTDDERQQVFTAHDNATATVDNYKSAYRDNDTDKIDELQATIKQWRTQLAKANKERG